MKKRFLVAAMAATMISPLAANASADVYGKVHASYDMNSGDDSTDNNTITSRASRLGVKGSEDLGKGLKVVYKMEFGVGITDEKKTADKQSNNLQSRNQYVGLSGAMGTVLLGRHDTPMKMAQGKFDQFNDTIADMGGMVRGENRLDNVLALVSPSMGGMKAVLALVPGEEDGAGADPMNGFADGISVAFSYKAKDMFVSLSNNSGDLVVDQTRLVGTFKVEGMELGALYSTSDLDTADDETSMGVSFGMMAGPGKVKFQYIDTADAGGVAGADETRTDLGYEVKMSKSTAVYAMYDTFKEDDKSAMSFGIVHSF